jgi:LacI family transcriptional regulator
MDDEGAAQQATRHLLGLGHRSIGFIAGPADYQLSSWRVDGWRATMDEAGLTTEGLLAVGDFSYASGELAARALLTHPEKPTAIIVSNDQMALATIEVAHALGLSIPADLSLVCFDNTPLVRFTRPPLTAIDQPVAEITARAVELLISAQRGELPAPVPVVVPASLVVRESTAAPRNAG